MQSFFKKNNKLNRGFTLLETLVAVAIFTVSILGLMSVLSDGIADTTYAKKKMIAAYLAQEGIEYVRNLRDTYVLYSSSGQTGWDAFNTRLLSNGCNLDNGCYFDDQALNYADQTQPMLDIIIVACGSSCNELLYNSASGKYNYDASGGASSGYTRKIQTTVISANETKVSSTVFWVKGSGLYQITFSESLFNWVE